MINNILLNEINKHNPSSIIEIKNALKEVLQKIILSGLGKSNFFNGAVFYGGTSLRVFRNLPRFSEDLDFTLINKDVECDFNNCLLFAKRELESLGINCCIRNKDKSFLTTVDTRYFEFNLKSLFDISFPIYSSKIVINELITIKVELERNAFLGGITEMKLLTYPSLTQIRTYSMETLFASKLIAVLNRKWKTRIKGRDYYDYLFYIMQNVKPNMMFLENGLKQFGFIDGNVKYTLDLLKSDLRDKFSSVDFNNAINDVKPFVSNDDRIVQFFNKEIFLASIDLI